MAKPYYAEYVNHILRFYFRYEPGKGFKNDVDKMNYAAAYKVIGRMSDMDSQILSDLFHPDDFDLPYNVVVAAKKHGIDQAKIWSLVSTTTTKIAKERKLL